MPYADPQMEREAARKRKARMRAKRHAERYGENAGDQRGKQGTQPKASRQHRWKPGGSVGSTGHVKLRVGKGHPLADPNGYAYEHLVVWVSAGNSRPARGQVIHHKNGDKTDNRVENLEVMTRSEHNALHIREDARRCPQTGQLLGKRAAGRLLDGMIHDARPEVSR